MTEADIKRLKDRTPHAVSSIISFFFKNPSKLIITIIIGNDLTNLSVSVIIASIFIDFWGDNSEYLAIFVSTVILLLFGEIIPKNIAIRFPNICVTYTAFPLNIIYKATSPIRNIVEWIISIINPRSAEGKKKTITESEFKTLVKIGKSEGELESEESKMIHNVIEFEDISILKVMTPRTDMFCLDIDTGLGEVLSKLKEYRFSRVPIYKDTIDNIVGILYAKELLKYINIPYEDFNMQKILHPPFFVVTTKKLNELMSEFKKEKVHMAVVMDEYGGVEGLITMEDILEEVFGEIGDEFDSDNIHVRKISDNTMKVSGMLSLDEFNKIFDMHISHEEIDTIAGYLLHLFGRIPKKGERISSEGLIFTIEKMKGARIMEIKVERPTLGDISESVLNIC